MRASRKVRKLRSERYAMGLDHRCLNPLGSISSGEIESLLWKPGRAGVPVPGTTGRKKGGKK